jgi:hypothetical protein
MAEISVPKSSDKFHCKTCDYTSSRQSQYDRHLATDKHKRLTVEHFTTDQYKCPNCEKTYKHMSSLCKHKLLCSKQPIYAMDVEATIQTKDKDKDFTEKELMLTILKENSELKTMILDVYKTMASTNNSSNNNNNNNNNNSINHSHNKTFNIQVYLNEDCKNALNLSEFVSSIQLQLHDLEETGRLGYVDGVSQIINTKLNDLEATMRPIQCSDVKRETLYIKEENQWFKEDEKKEKIKNAIKQITRKNIQQIPTWVKANPGCTDAQSKDNDTYLQIVFNAMSGDSTEEQYNNVNKIVTKVSKGAAIDK